MQAYLGVFLGTVQAELRSWRSSCEAEATLDAFICIVQRETFMPSSHGQFNNCMAHQYSTASVERAVNLCTRLSICVVFTLYLLFG